MNVEGRVQLEHEMSCFEGKRKRNFNFYTVSMLLLFFHIRLWFDAMPWAETLPWYKLSQPYFFSIHSLRWISSLVLVVVKSSFGIWNEMWFFISAVWVKSQLNIWLKTGARFKAGWGRQYRFLPYLKPRIKTLHITPPY